MMSNSFFHVCHENCECQLMRYPVDLKRMRYVLELARAEAVTTAAQTLGVTQSALSRSLSEVEEALGTALFHRLPRGISLTSAGERFVSGAKRLLGDMDSFVAHVKDARDLAGGRLRLGIAPAGYISHIAASLVLFAREHPDVAIETVTGSTQALCPRLINGEFDLMVGSSSYLKRWRDIEVVPLARMHFAGMVRLGHPLARRGEPPCELDVLAFPFILPESVEPMYSDIGQRFAHHELPPFQPRYVVDDFDLARRILRATDAVYPMMHPDPQFGGLGRHFGLLRDVLVLPSHFLSVAYSPARARSRAARRFEDLVVGTLGVAPTEAHRAA